MTTNEEKLAISSVVTVKWVDTTNVAAWQTQEEVEEFATDHAWVCHNVGWISYEDADCVVVSSRRSGSGHWGLSERIPRAAIVERSDQRVDHSLDFLSEDERRFLPNIPIRASDA